MSCEIDIEMPIEGGSVGVAVISKYDSD